jgi:hypothetical protein
MSEKEFPMKLLLALLAAAGLSGCAVYGHPYGYPYGTAEVHYSTGTPYYGGHYYYGHRPSYIHGYGARGYGRGSRDRDRDGIPNRYDRDRDGDGVPNRHDARPYNPRRH